MKKNVITLSLFLIYAAIMFILGINDLLSKNWGNLIWGVGFIISAFYMLLNKNGNSPFKSSAYILCIFGYFGLAYYLFNILDIKHVLLVSFAVSVILIAITVLLFSFLNSKIKNEK